MTVNDKILAKYYEVISESKQEMFDCIASDRTNFLTVVMENTMKDHNASAVLRTCDCFGIQQLHALEKGVKYEIQREIARGAGNWVDLKTFHGEDPVKNCFTELKSKGYRIITTSPHAEKSIHEIDISTPMALVFGTERDGVSEEAIEYSDELVSIPMYGFTESFNVSVSAAVILNVLRHRLSNENFNWKLNHDERTAVKINWCEKIVKEGPLVTKEFERRILEKE
jgi:tRNA (guanosine-2'-O-)-methyltransferase